MRQLPRLIQQIKNAHLFQRGAMWEEISALTTKVTALEAQEQRVRREDDRRRKIRKKLGLKMDDPIPKEYLSKRRTPQEALA
jgi:hypothetical protein